MPDIEKVIKGIESCIGHCNFNECPYFVDSCKEVGCNGNEVLKDALELLKEQEDIGKELETAIELIHKKNKRIEKLNAVLNEQPQIVRCGECKHKYYELSDGRIVCTHIDKEGNDEHGADWFCADGVKKDD